MYRRGKCSQNRSSIVISQSKLKFNTYRVIQNALLIMFNVYRGIGEPKYMPITNWDTLNKILTDALQSYNELNAAMDLVNYN